jgi:hypothetical protein
LAGVLSVGLGLSPAMATEKHEGSAEKPAWLNKLEKQLDYEDMMSGKTLKDKELMDKTFMNLMKQMKGQVMEHATPASEGGAYHTSWAEHQLGMGYLLGPTGAGDKIYQGARCPSGAPVKSYEVSAINVEITLNQWGDYFPV